MQKSYPLKCIFNHENVFCCPKPKNLAVDLNAHIEFLFTEKAINEHAVSDLWNV